MSPTNDEQMKRISELLSGDLELMGYVQAVLQELHRARQKHPHWPSDPVHAAAILGEESGELIKEALDCQAGQGDFTNLQAEAVQCGAMALRFLLNSEHYQQGKQLL